jgi:hypothetical protein
LRLALDQRDDEICSKPFDVKPLCRSQQFQSIRIAQNPFVYMTFDRFGKHPFDDGHRRIGRGQKCSRLS